MDILQLFADAHRMLFQSRKFSQKYKTKLVSCFKGKVRSILQTIRFFGGTYSLAIEEHKTKTFIFSIERIDVQHPYMF